MILVIASPEVELKLDKHEYDNTVDLNNKQTKEATSNNEFYQADQTDDRGYFILNHS